MNSLLSPVPRLIAVATMAQPKSIPRLAVLLYSNPQSDPKMAAICRGLGDLGYLVGQNIIIEYRYAEGQLDRLPILAGQVVGLQPNVILAIGGDVSPIAKKVDERIPLDSPVALIPSSLVSSKVFVGQEVATGVTLLQDALASKRLELLKEAAPKISKVAFLWNPDHPDNEQRAAQLAVQTLGLELQSIEVRSTNDFKSAFRTANSTGADSIYVVSSRQTVLNIKKNHSICDNKSNPIGRRMGSLGKRRRAFFVRTGRHCNGRSRSQLHR